MKKASKFQPSESKRKPSLSEMLSRITKENRHAETDWGDPVGKEIVI